MASELDNFWRTWSESGITPVQKTLKNVERLSQNDLDEMVKNLKQLNLKSKSTLKTLQLTTSKLRTILTILQDMPSLKLRPTVSFQNLEFFAMYFFANFAIQFDNDWRRSIIASRDSELQKKVLRAVRKFGHENFCPPDLKKIIKVIDKFDTRLVPSSLGQRANLNQLSKEFVMPVQYKAPNRVVIIYTDTIPIQAVAVKQPELGLFQVLNLVHGESDQNLDYQLFNMKARGPRDIGREVSEFLSNKLQAFQGSVMQKLDPTIYWIKFDDSHQQLSKK